MSLIRLNLAFMTWMLITFHHALCQTVQWHSGTSAPPPLTVSPTSPATMNLITYVALTDGKTYTNPCWANGEEGRPSISIDTNNQVIQVLFTPLPPGWECTLDYFPVNGISGQVGPLSAGTWAFNVWVAGHPLTNSFYVSGPPVLAVQTVPNPPACQLAWPLMKGNFVLESTTDLTDGAWQTVTNTTTTNYNRCSLQIQIGSSNRFFRLRQL